jgi:hypothetical protein
LISLHEIAHTLDGKVRGNSVTCRCSTHDDRTPSLSVRQTAEGKLLVKCHAGCPQEEVIAALKTRGLWPENGPKPRLNGERFAHAGAVLVAPIPANVPAMPEAHPELGKPSTRWPYRDASGRLLFEVWRFELRDGGKTFRPISLWRMPGGRLEWRWESLPAPRPLFNLDELAANPDKPVVICEGEKAALAAVPALS